MLRVFHLRSESNGTPTAILATLAVVVTLATVALVGGAGVATATTGDAPPATVAGLQAQADADLGLSVTASGVEDGNVTVELTLSNEGPDDSDAPVVRLGQLPEGWAVVAQSSDGAAYRPSTNEWLWVSLAEDAEVTVTATLSVPEDANTDRQLDVVAADADGNEANASAAVGGGGGEGALAGLSLPLVAAGAGALVVLGVVVAVVRRRRGGGDESGRGSRSGRDR